MVQGNKAKYTCKQCGAILSRGRQAFHEKSVSHIYADTIRKSLDNPNVTFTEVAHGLGLTRERVRQIAQVMGYPNGRKRLEVVRRHQLANQFKAHPVLSQLSQEALRHGLKVEGVKVRSPRTPYGRLLTSQVFINQKLCAVRSASPSIFKTHRYFSISRRGTVIDKDKNLEFVIIKCKDTGWLIIPRDKSPVKSTKIVVGREPIFAGANNMRHDWQEYFNAWEQLK